MTGDCGISLHLLPSFQLQAPMNLVCALLRQEDMFRKCKTVLWLEIPGWWYYDKVVNVHCQDKEILVNLYFRLYWFCSSLPLPHVASLRYPIKARSCGIRYDFSIVGARIEVHTSIPYTFVDVKTVNMYYIMRSTHDTGNTFNFFQLENGSFSSLLETPWSWTQLSFDF